MRVAMYYNNADVRIEEMPVPKAGPGELLVKVLASGICGSDVLEWYRIKKAPLVLGHEIAGDIVETGEGVERYKAGDRVFVSHHVPCDICHYCLNGHHTACETLHTTNYDPGGFSEYIRVPRINAERGVFLLPDEMSYEDAAFIEPLACVVRGQRIAGLRPGQSVLIMGSGVSGLLHLLLARAAGIRQVIMTDVNKYRLRMARHFGARETIDAIGKIPERLREANDGRLADLVIVCTGARAAFHQALESADRGGTILFFAAGDPGADLPVPVQRFWRNEMRLATSYGNSPEEAVTALNLINSDSVPVNGLITHKLNLARTGLGFNLVAGAGESLKVIIEPHQ